MRSNLLALSSALLSACAVGDPRVDSAVAEAPEVADLRVWVQDAAGIGIPGAWVVVRENGRDAEVGADGAALFPGMGAGTWTLGVAAEGYAPSEATVEVGAAGAVAEVVLDPRDPALGTMGGVVWLPGAVASPAVGARVVVDEVTVAMADADGVWQAEGLAVGDHTLSIQGPVGSSLGPWSSTLAVSAGQRTRTDVVLPGGAPAEADFVGSAVCVGCHPDADHAGDGHRAALVTRAEVEAQGPEALVAAFAAGEVVALDPMWPGATVTLGADWTMTVTDAAGVSSGALPVVEVYGGHAAGLAFGVAQDGAVRVAPIAWALPRVRDDDAGFVPTYADAWIDAAGLRDAATLDWTLDCAGCHVTGHRLVAEAGVYSLAPVGAGEVEAAVGCEACHGAGSVHAEDSSASSILDPSRLPAAERLSGCARCHEPGEARHTVDGVAPAWPIEADGRFAGPNPALDDLRRATSSRWAGMPESRVAGDQVGDLRASPHHIGPWLGACEDCHDAHGSSFAAGLHVDPADPALCTSCHASAFPDAATQMAHGRHLEAPAGAWSANTCAGCHLGRSGVRLQVDPRSGTGEAHAHTLAVLLPEDTLVAFGEADTLALGAAPMSACLDCHLQARALAQDAGVGISCPVGDATERRTHENLDTIYAWIFGGAE